MMSLSALLLVALGVAGCVIVAAAVLLSVWAITHDRRPPSN
jgi:hypothetical protein